MKLSKLGSLVVAALSLFAVDAGAVSFYVSPTAGNPWLGDQNMKARTDARAYFTSLDGEICVEGDSMIAREWQTPIQIDATGVNYTLYQTAETYVGNVKTRVLTLNPDGSVHGLTAWVTSNTKQLQNVGTAYVPGNGTLFAQSLLSSGDPDASGEHACVNMYRVIR
jgi:hypothetical protein